MAVAAKADVFLSAPRRVFLSLPSLAVLGVEFAWAAYRC